jgi:hypothetical protein
MGLHDSIKNLLKTYCPKCKTNIYRMAHICPLCGYDFNSLAYKKRKDTELKYIRYWLFICIFIFLSLLFKNSETVLAFTLCIFLFGGGLILILKISKYSNLFH